MQSLHLLVVKVIQVNAFNERISSSSSDILLVISIVFVFLINLGGTDTIDKGRCRETCSLHSQVILEPINT